MGREEKPTSAPLTILIPLPPPSWNHSYRIARVAGHLTLVKTPEARTFQDAVSLIVKTIRPSGWECPREVFLVYRMGLKRSMDGDNVLKLVNDAIARALGVDDKSFLPLVTERTTGVKSPFLEVSLYDAADYDVALTRKQHPAEP